MAVIQDNCSVNKDGRKVYDRDFLLKLQSDPNSQIKPSLLPDMDVILKDSSRPPMDNLQLGKKNIFQWSRNIREITPKTVTPNKYCLLDTIPSDQDRRTPLPFSGSRSSGPTDYTRSDYKSSYDGRKSPNGGQQIGYRFCSSRFSSEDNSLHDSSQSQRIFMPPPQPIKSVLTPAPVSVPIKATPTVTEEQLIKKTTNIINDSLASMYTCNLSFHHKSIRNEFLLDPSILNDFLIGTNMFDLLIEIRQTFDNSTFANFVQEALNYVLEKSTMVRQRVSQLTTFLIDQEALPLSLYLTGLGEVLETAEDLVIDIPKIWVYLAELIWYPLAINIIPFSQLRNIMVPLKKANLAGKLLGELLTLLIRKKGSIWTKERWEKSGLQWSDFLQENESVPDFIKKYIRDCTEEDVKTETLYKRVRVILNNLTLKNVYRSAKYVSTLEIDSDSKLQDVVDLACDKGIDEPSFSVAIALMFRELVFMRTFLFNGEIIIHIIQLRCKMELEQNTVDETTKAIKLKEIDEFTDLEKKKELLLTLEEEERRMRIRSVGKIRFMGELFKQQMLSARIMHLGIRHLLQQIDEESLVCLCELLSTVGKDLEAETRLDTYFDQMMDFVNSKLPGEVSQRLRFMLQVVIELRMNDWVPRQDNRNSKTMDRFRRNAETKRLYTDMNYISMNKPRKCDRNKDTLRGGDPTDIDGWYSLYYGSKQHDATHKLKNKPILTAKQLIKKTTNILNEFLADTNIDNAFIEICKTFDNSTFINFVREALNYVLEKSKTARRQVSELMTHLVAEEALPLSLYLTGLGEVLKTSADLVIDIPQIWVYLAELIWYPVAKNTISFHELKTIMAPLRSAGLAGTLLGELLTLFIQGKGPNWTEERWEKSGLHWNDFLQEKESVPAFIKKYKLEFMAGESNSGLSTAGEQLGMERIEALLFALLSNEKEYSFHNINSWISANVGSRVNKPQFIRVLMTAILKASIESYNDGCHFKEEKFENLQPLIARYVDVDKELESHCLIATQEYIRKLEHPEGMLLQVVSKLW